jgi:NADPH:quinone reductase-like Zn-dependent oxidoreductase
MKAIVLTKFGGAENFEIREVENPQLKEGAVKIKIKAAAFNPIDYQMRQGASESKLLKSVILGREMSGVVVETDFSVQRFKIGDEVFGYVGDLASNGTYAEETVAPEVLLAHKPANLSFNQATAIPLVGLTAYQTVRKCAIKPSDKVFVAGGAGGVGSMIIRLLRLSGVENIFTTAGNEDSAKQLLELGLANENILDYRDSNLINSLLELSNGDKMDFCLDTVGGRMSELSAEVLKVDGVYADITFLTTATARETLFGKGVTVVNVANYAYGLEGDTEKIRFYGESLEILKQQIEAGNLAAMPIQVVGKLSAETVASAHDLLEKNMSRGKKLVMEIN